MWQVNSSKRLWSPPASSKPGVQSTEVGWGQGAHMLAERQGAGPICRSFPGEPGLGLAGTGGDPLASAPWRCDPARGASDTPPHGLPKPASFQVNRQTLPRGHRPLTPPGALLLCGAELADRPMSRELPALVSTKGVLCPTGVSFYASRTPDFNVRVRKA